MKVDDILNAIDDEIQRLQQARDLLTAEAPARPARPSERVAHAGKRRPMSAEARAKIAAAQRRRWAKEKSA